MANPNDLSGWTIVFDLDGTLIETAPDLVGALTTVLVEEGLDPPPYEKLRMLIGRGGRWMALKALELAGALPTTTELDRLFERMLVVYRTRIADESRPYPGALDALDALTARGATLAICTNKRTELSIALFDALGLT
ncbi:MAG: HAD family hydrolase, partial [Caulobacteraceae bacterium]